jgi:hypothetical protein
MGGAATQGLPAALRREDPRQEAEKASPPTPRVVHPTSRGLRASPPPGRYRPPHPPPKLKPSAETWDGVRDGGPNSRARRARPRVLSKRLHIHRHSSVSKLCPAAWAYLQVKTCRCFLTDAVRPVKSVPVGYVWGPWRIAKGGEVVTVHHARWHLPWSWIER